MDPSAAATPRRWPVLPLLFVAATALPCGAMMIASPDGSLMGLPLGLLRHAPFRTFLVPGLALGLCVGGSAAAAAVAVLLRHRAARLLTGIAGLVLLGWITVQVALIRTTSWLQALYLGLALVLLAAARR